MKFHDAGMLLGQLGKNGITEKTADQKLRGFPWNKVGPDGVLLIAQMAWEGYPRAVAYVLAKGADPNRTSGFLNGPTLAYAVTNNRSPARVKLEMVQTLLDHEGIDVDAKVTRAPHPRDTKDAFRTGTTLEYALDQATRELKIGKTFDADSQRSARSQLQSYRQTIPLLVAAGAAVSASAERRMKKLGVEAAAPATTKGWAKKARAVLAKKTFEKRDDVFELCEVLENRRAIVDPAWNDIVQAIIDASPAFEAVAKKVYGRAVSFEDDEGWLCQGWESYVLLDLVFELLAKEATLANGKWSRLVEHALRARVRCHAADITEAAVDALLACAWVKKHRDFSKLRALEKATRRSR